MDFKLGDKVRDKVTGYEGIAIGVAQHLYGCDTVGIKTTKLHDGKPIDCVWFDVLQVEKVVSRVSEVKPNGQGVG